MTFLQDEYFHSYERILSLRLTFDGWVSEFGQKVILTFCVATCIGTVPINTYGEKYSRKGIVVMLCIPCSHRGCFGCKLSTTDLTQIDFKNFSSTSLVQIVLTTCIKSANNMWHQIWFSKTWWNSIKPTGLMQLDSKL